MRLVYKEGFLKAVNLLPVSTRHKLDMLMSILAQNPFHPLLHTKLLMGGLRKKYSFRITRDWRVIFVFEEKEKIMLIHVGHRKYIYR